MAITPPATPILPPVIPAPPVAPNNQLISILINVINVGGVLVTLIQQSNNCRIIAQQDFPDTIWNFLDLEERGITNLVTAYESKRDPTERINFGLTTIRRLKGLLHWVQDQRRYGSPIITSNVTLHILTQALQQASDRKYFILQKEVNTKIAHPKKISKETSWTTWHDALVNYLSVLPGKTGIPLAYVVHFNFAPDYSIYYHTFNK